ncbi:MAG: hypothetical protein ACI93R_003011 [Flavobacteriales bacterium]|jgi:hypothetical protein
MIKLAAPTLIGLLSPVLLVANVNAQSDNIALNAQVSASSELLAATFAVDGNFATRWESAIQTDPSSITVDLGDFYSLEEVVIHWEAANAKTYTLSGSIDGNNWVVLNTQDAGVFGERQDVLSVAGSYRFLRIDGIERSEGNAWGYSIWEIEVAGEGLVVIGPVDPIPSGSNLSLNAVSFGSTEFQAAGNAIDGDSSTRWESEHNIEQTDYTVDLGSIYTLSSLVIEWEAANAKDYTVQGSTDGNIWVNLAEFSEGTFGNRVDEFALSGGYRYVRMNGHLRSDGNGWGYSIFEFEVYGQDDGTSPQKEYCPRPGAVQVF